MSAEREPTAIDVFSDAVDLAADARSAYLDAACAGRPDLRAEVDALLAAYPYAERIFDRVHLDAVARSAAAEFAAGSESSGDPNLGSQIGAYRVVSALGAGGMGAVYLGERIDDVFRKKVAIKLVRPGLVTPALLARFRTERQVLADLDHPGIARILDGGATPESVPYFVMEYVDGEPLDRWCRAAPRSLRERLDLFLEICDAVSYAHAHLVIHRDLKPGNILIGRDGRAKLLDFGIAKVVDEGARAGGEAREGETPGAATQHTVVALTPRYASPEQARGRRVSTATDVYSLGVVLYEMLAGALPYSLDGLSPGEMERTICEREPERPSRVARGRDARALAGDIDTITLKALAKDPARRYATVEEFAADLRRHLEGFPVLARPDTASYRLSRFVRRNKALVAATASMVVIVTAAFVTTFMAYRRAVESAERERKESAKVVAVNSFLQEMISSVNPWTPSGRHDMTVREAIDRATESVDQGSLREEPDVEAAVRGSLGEAYRVAGDFPKAERHLNLALDHFRKVHGPISPEVARTLHALAEVLSARGMTAPAESLHREVLSIRRALNVEVGLSLNDLGLLALNRGDLDEADSLLTEAVGLVRGVGKENDPDLVTCLHNLAGVARSRGYYARAESLYRETLTLRRQAGRGAHPEMAQSMNNLALLLRKRGNPAEAEILLRESLTIFRRHFGDGTSVVALGLNNLGRLLIDTGDHAGADSLLTSALAMRRQLHGENHPVVANSMNNLGRLRLREGNLAEADRIIRQSLAILGTGSGSRNADLGATLHVLGDVAVEMGDAPEAEPHLKEALSIARATLPQRHPDLVGPLGSLGDCLVRLDRAAEAESLLRESFSICEEDLLPGALFRHEVASYLGASLAEQGKFLEAEALLVPAAEGLLAAGHAPANLQRQCLARLASLYAKWGRREKAEEWEVRWRSSPGFRERGSPLLQ